MKNITTAALAAAIATTITAGALAAAYPGQQYAARAHVALPQARAIALRTVSGTIVSQELEYERGGSGLRYTFDIKTARGVREVGVDARDGAVLENSADATTSLERPESGESGGEAGERAGG
ncbi:MAG: PepSY domain-containing protein [Candidatus Eremiobacteraeota bacterium]|nr:PepSY domain-containing protein [Candidatus Eremiobacteraeota bacterium]